MNGQAKIMLPAPTPWPLVLAFGLTLVAAGLVTTAAVSLVGALLCLRAGFGWFREVLPEERLEAVPVREEAIVIATRRREVERPQALPGPRRLRLPTEVHPVAAGVRGGLAGSAAMAVVAMLYGWICRHSPWYPVNLLGAIIYARAAPAGAQSLHHFSLVLFLVAAAIHLPASILVGLLYGAMLPMLPRHPVALGGGVVPVLWSGLVYGMLGFVDPILNARINWWWFVGSQVAYGCVAGLIVVRHRKVRLPQASWRQDGENR